MTIVQRITIPPKPIPIAMGLGMFVKRTAIGTEMVFRNAGGLEMKIKATCAWGAKR